MSLTEKQSSFIVAVEGIDDVKWYQGGWQANDLPENVATQGKSHPSTVFTMVELPERRNMRNANG
jgi:hypothetical protein